MTGPVVVYNPPIPNPAYVSPVGQGTANARDWADTPNAAWAPSLSPVPGGTPDPMRTGHMPVRDDRPDPRYHSREWYLGVHGRGRDRIQRHAVEFQDSDGKTAEIPQITRFAPKPYQTTEPRPTNRMSPSTYTFTRPFDQTFARHLNGQHFSMADHQREYPILGMEPTRRRRNTFRAEPTPWDADLVDTTSPSVVTPRPGQVVSVEVPASRNFRLV